ncbi:MAG: HAD family hydrolase [Candidatus Omnitrophota bacterium]
MMKTLFIDRDGVINKDPGGWTAHEYVTELKDLHFLPGALDALALLNRNRIQVIVVSNQAGVNKGFFTKERLDEITRSMLSEVKKRGGDISEVFYCTHTNEDNCDCRKPKPGMLEAAIRKHGVTARDTYIVGDSEVDILAGRSAGLKTIFVLSGKTGLEQMKAWKVKPDYVFRDLLEAVKWILVKDRRKSERSTRREKEGRKR